mmetsp:Transcript_94127/g.265804  ORF Transcript_94127/g.265804 Transcript_94127/m.265804 type:complete len:337 (+) Transcript_94127:18-1028(+)
MNNRLELRRCSHLVRIPGRRLFAGLSLSCHADEGAGGECGTEKRSHPKHPVILERRGLVVFQLRHYSRTERTSGIDGATVNRDQHRVGKKDGEPDGNARQGPVTCRQRVHSGFENGVHQEERAHDLGRQRVGWFEALRDGVRAEPACAIFPLREHDRQDGSSENRAQKLRGEVAKGLLHVELPRQHEAEGHRTIDLATTVMSDHVGQHCDCEAKRQRHLQHPRRASFLRDAHGAAAAEGHEKRHGDEFRGTLTQHVRRPPFRTERRTPAFDQRCAQCGSSPGGIAGTVPHGLRSVQLAEGWPAGRAFDALLQQDITRRDARVYLRHTADSILRAGP